MGLSRKAMRHRIVSGDWVAHGPRVLRRAGAPWVRGSPLLRALLDAGPGAVLSHGTAAAWWGLPGFDLRTIEVTRPRGVTGTPVAFADRLHEVLTLGADHVTVLEGIPIVRPERVVLELCASAHPAVPSGPSTQPGRRGSAPAGPYGGCTTSWRRVDATALC